MSMQTVINIGLLEDNVKFKNFLWSFPKWSKVSLFQLLNPFKWLSPVNHHGTKPQLEKSIFSVLLENVTTSAEEWKSGNYIMASHWSWGSGAWQKHFLVSDHHIYLLHPHTIQTSEMISTVTQCYHKGSSTSRLIYVKGFCLQRILHASSFG